MTSWIFFIYYTVKPNILKHMKKLKIDWKWTAGTFIALAGIIVTVIIFYYDNTPTSLGYNVESVINVGDQGKDSFEKLNFSYDNLVIEEGSIVTISFENKGRKPIRSKDFESPIKIVLKNASLIASRLKESYPKSLEPIITHDEESIFISPMLLNNNDKFTIQFLTNKKFQSFDVVSRIAGISSILEFQSSEKPYRYLLGIVSILFSFLSFIILEYLQSSSFRRNRHVAIYLTIFPFFFVQFTILASASIFFMTSLSLFKLNMNLWHIALSAVPLVVLSMFLGKLLFKKAYITFTEKNNGMTFFEISLKDKISNEED